MQVVLSLSFYGAVVAAVAFCIIAINAQFLAQAIADDWQSSPASAAKERRRMWLFGILAVLGFLVAITVGIIAAVNGIDIYLAKA